MGKPQTDHRDVASVQDEQRTNKQQGRLEMTYKEWAILALGILIGFVASGMTIAGIMFVGQRL